MDPKIVFYKTENGKTTKPDNRSMITIDRISPYELNESDLRETAYFPGSENPITYSRIYSLDFKYSFELHRYPFDTQICEIVMVVTFKEAIFVKIMANKVLYKGPVKMLT